jgi:antitoxin HicB
VEAKGSHLKLRHGSGRTVIPMHRGDLPPGTFRGILRQLGLTSRIWRIDPMRYAYPVDIMEAPEGVTVTFPDVPEAITCGDTTTEALAQAQDALVSALSFYVDDGKELPRPSAARGRPMVAVTILEAAKLALHDAMINAKVSNVDLGRKLGLDEKAVRRLRDPLHRSHVGQVEAALHELGRRVELVVEDAG